VAARLSRRRGDEGGGVLCGEREEGGSVGNGREAGWGKREGGAAYILGFATGWTVGRLDGGLADFHGPAGPTSLCREQGSRHRKFYPKIIIKIATNLKLFQNIT
jgi:hypothetical protein